MSEGQPTPVPSPDHEGGQSSHIETTVKLRNELIRFGADAKVGSPKLLVIDDMQQEFQSLQDILKAQRAPDSPEKQENVIVEKLNRKQLQREIKHRRGAVEGYNGAHKELTTLTDALNTHYQSDGTSAMDAENALSVNLSDLREDILNGTLKPITSEQTTPRPPA
jgi:hypothetical protein